MKKWHYWLISILLLLITTNPGMKAFKDYLGCKDCNVVKREYNFFVISFYFAKYNGEYCGILGNFFLVEKYQRFQLLPK